MYKCKGCRTEFDGDKCPSCQRYVKDYPEFFSFFNPGAGQVGMDFGGELGIGLGGGLSMDFDGDLNISGISITGD